ncbi:hypothetical protein CAPTEDRAFT_181535 [Capitella teleta]|uniref:AB hydrolase-1 domain-containing protein n=1 Tax=Capitella teleta TaxID=283909 RepID=R7UQA8_CAPTE|nr:hypothetical protein CAPTEDRAFT_181535 [Capitella teleta]|eukprot:ELU06107.1 hypothetical protein CAPTEDRAFT_181535 [Capitella teleta]
MPENGLLYDIGHGQKLYLSCMGTGSPTVVLDAPTGMSSDAWALVQPILAKTTKVCVYDRAGLGFSDRPPPNVTDAEPGDENFSQQLAANKWQPFTVERMADDLHCLITYSSSQEKPLILVGAELGAVVSRFYTQIYESDVSDLVLVDPLVEKLMIEEETTANLWAKYWYAIQLIVFMLKQFPQNVSVTVLNGNYYDDQLPSPLNQAWAKSQQLLLTKMHPNSKHILINGADHHMVYRKPEVIAEQIRKVVKSRRLSKAS